MGKIISVASFEDMAKASRKLKGISETYTEIYTQLMQEATTMGSAWEGEDNQYFVRQIEDFTNELEAMARKLMTASEALDEQRANYVAQQDDNILKVQKLVN